jgi:hypothetical protein
VLGEAVFQAGGQGCVQFGVAGITGRDMFNMNNLLPITGLGGEVTEKSRGIHGDSLKGQYFNLIVEYLYLKATLDDKIDHLGQDFIGMPLVVADTADAQRGQLPSVVVVNLSYGNGELAFNPADDGF